MNIELSACKENKFEQLSILFNKCFNFDPGINYFKWKYQKNSSF